MSEGAESLEKLWKESRYPGLKVLFDSGVEREAVREYAQERKVKMTLKKTYVFDYLFNKQAVGKVTVLCVSDDPNFLV